MLKKLIVPFLVVSSMTMAGQKGIVIGEKNFNMNLPYFEMNGKPLKQVNADVAVTAKILINKHYNTNVFEKIKDLVEDKNASVQKHNPMYSIHYNYQQIKNNFNIESIEIILTYGDGRHKNLTYNLDKKTGKIINFTNIFTKSGVKFLKKDLLNRVMQTEQELDVDSYKWNNIPIFFVGNKIIFNPLYYIPSNDINLTPYTYTKQELLSYIKPQYR